MPEKQRPLIAVTRGSPLALTQTRQVLAECRALFPEWQFEYAIVKTTGDKLQKASMAQPNPALPKGLFTKELEIALLEGRADLAIHSLKDLPTELPDGLELGAVPLRADPRDVLIYRSRRGAAAASGNAGEAASGNGPVRRWFAPGLTLAQLPEGATLATSSTRRREQLLAVRPDLRVVEVRGNVGTRLQKLLQNAELDGTLLAAAGLGRLGYRIGADGSLSLRPAGEAGAASDWIVQPEFHVSLLPVEEMLPCVGQAALGIEIRSDDPRMRSVCERLTHFETRQCVVAERAFLRAMGGGCQSPVAAYAEAVDGGLRLRAVSFRDGPAKSAALNGPMDAPEALGQSMAGRLR
ncbi:MAG: hydroxymethylbilane synthase [Verrucomicrobiales bacterium]|nr:hydroxymethylbilane synthase [Verrucomicrobiales bacterium]